LKKIKITLFLTALAFAGLIVYQNMSYLLTPASLKLNLWVIEPYASDGIINAQLILGTFFAGLLISYFCSLSFRYKTNKTLKNLNATLNAHQETISSLKNQLDRQESIPLPQDSQQPGVSSESP
jgi:hypothetical protein